MFVVNPQSALITQNFRCSHRYNYYMAIFSVTFLLLSYQLTNLLGPVGFILANCTNMIFRISYSTLYIYKQYRPIEQNPLNGIRPGKIFFVVLLVMGIVCKVSQVSLFLQSSNVHCAAAVISFFFRHEFSKNRFSFIC